MPDLNSAMKYIFITACYAFLSFAISVNAQENLWNGKKCAVVLTYDDALHGHLDQAVPALDSVGFKGTFYLTAFATGSKDRIEDWRRAAANSHELGNHTLFHPCIGNRPGREWVSKERNLNSYSMERMLEEIRMTNVYLQAIDGKTERTFAYPCGDMTVGDSSYVRQIQADFVSARGVARTMHPFSNGDLFNVGSYMVNGESGVQLVKLVQEAMASGKLLVFLFHGVGGEHNLNVDLQAHRELLAFLKAHEREIWVAPFIDITRFIESKHGNK